MCNLQFLFIDKFVQSVQTQMFQEREMFHHIHCLLRPPLPPSSLESQISQRSGAAVRGDAPFDRARPNRARPLGTASRRPRSTRGHRAASDPRVCGQESRGRCGAVGESRLLVAARVAHARMATATGDEIMTDTKINPIRAVDE